MNLASPQFSIVIPAYNESANITSSLTQIINFMEEYASYEIIVVDDGSGDNTVEVVEKYMEHAPKKLRLIKNPHKGKGPTVWKGVMEAEGDYIYMFDADGAAPISELKKLAIWIKDHDYDVVIASREGLGARRIGEPFYRHLMGRVFNFLVKIVALPGIQDSQCGFKLFKRDVAKRIFKKMKIYGEDAPEIKHAYTGAFDVEVLYLAKKFGYKVRSVPVTWTYIKTTRVNPIRDSINMTRDIFKVRVFDFRGGYK